MPQTRPTVPSVEARTTPAAPSAIEQERKGRLHRGVLSLSVSAFAIGVAEFIVVGMLPAISGDLAISLESAGALVSLYALALGVGTPFLVLMVSRLPRKSVLAGLMLVFMVGNLLAAMAPGYHLLLLGRIVTAVTHGTFFAIGAMVASSLAPQGHAGRAIAAMFAGLTLAMVVGVPLGSFLGNLLGWRLPFFVVAGLAALGLLALLAWLPGNIAAGDGGKIGTQLAAMIHPAILTMMSVTALGFGASFAAFTYVTPLLTDISGFSLGVANLLLVVFGAATFVGNLAGGHLASRFGWQQTLRLLLVLLAVAQVVLAQTLRQPWAVTGMLFVWGFLAFGMSPAFQAGMLATAELHTPRAVDFASGLNISAFNFGISIGAAMGGVMVSHGLMAATPWAGAVISLAALAPLLWLPKMGAGQQRS